jgi:hypothetical protein
MPSDIPTAIWSGTFTVMGVELKCHTLDNGQRIIEAESLELFLKALDEGHIVNDGYTDFYRWQRGD